MEGYTQLDIEGYDSLKQTIYYLATLYIHRSVLSSVHNIEEDEEETTDEGTPLHVTMHQFNRQHC